MNGVIFNVVAVLAGTFVGFLFGGLIPEHMRSIASGGNGLATSVTGAMMARGGRRDLAGSHLGDYAPLVLVGSPSRLSSSEVVFVIPKQGRKRVFASMQKPDGIF